MTKRKPQASDDGHETQWSRGQLLRRAQMLHPPTRPGSGSSTAARAADCSFKGQDFRLGNRPDRAQ